MKKRTTTTEVMVVSLTIDPSEDRSWMTRVLKIMAPGCREGKELNLLPACRQPILHPTQVATPQPV